jgi:hypothetical protein
VTALTLALLGAYHGLNPAMGWLFAVSMGFQEGRAGGVLRAIPPIAVGHAASVAAVIAAASAARLVLPLTVLRWLGAALLVGFAAVLALRRFAHPRWVGMRIGFRDLVLWSFLMSSAHGAGLMLLPVLLRPGAAGAAGPHAHPAPATWWEGAWALGVHTTAMLATLTAVALLVYGVVGLGVLRRAWINLDYLWAAALLVAGIVTLAVG